MSWGSIPWGTIFALLDLLLLVGLGLLVRWSPRVSAGLTKIVSEELTKQLAPIRVELAKLRAAVAVSQVAGAVGAQVDPDKETTAPLELLHRDRN